ncbi:hypothetical protein [Rhodanobacter sp. DHG33]|uniref:hypothetical protein n=1 Tax=Rhodanobacter sp. DHG33 TaxID=2775921 RepID=UPI00178678AB|nr:hypothetical protein [Rhodanobacter sp. DHG33]MBD8898704.1 hypothetical protein [Rhodanobacter sp. DHG33]
MQPTRLQPAAVDAESIRAAPAMDHPSRGTVLLQVLAIGGYGMWLWLGLSLLLGLSPLGRRGTLIPLALSAALVGIGLLLARPRLSESTTRHGQNTASDHRPPRSMPMALATWLLMLAAAALAQSSNSFWITRLAGALLMLCSLVSLLQATHDDRTRLPTLLQRATALLPACRITTAAYAGGLWLWLSVLAQGKFVSDHGTYLWILLLLALALGLGLLESALWQSLREPEAFAGETTPDRGWLPTRLVAALLTYALPCTALLLGGMTGNLPVAAIAAPGCALGLALERHLYQFTLATTISPQRA